MSQIDNPKCVITQGVFVSLFDHGVLLIGESGIGKSDLALSLLDRGHALIADDMVEFKMTDQNTLLGSAPKVLKNCLNIRDLGVLDVASLLGQKSVVSQKILSLAVKLQKTVPPSSDIIPSQGTFSLLGVTIPLLHLCLSSGRPSEILLETWVRSYHLREQRGKESMSRTFLKKHHQLLSVIS